MLPFTIRISNHHLTLHQHNSYQYNHATSSNITTPQPTSLSKQITLPPSRDIFLRFPHPSTSLSFCNSDSFRPPDTILWYPSIHHLQPELWHASLTEHLSSSQRPLNACSAVKSHWFVLARVLVPYNDVAGLLSTENACLMQGMTLWKCDNHKSGNGRRRVLWGCKIIAAMSWMQMRDFLSRSKRCWTRDSDLTLCELVKEDARHSVRVVGPLVGKSK